MSGNHYAIVSQNFAEGSNILIYGGFSNSEKENFNKIFPLLAEFKQADEDSSFYLRGWCINYASLLPGEKPITLQDDIVSIAEGKDLKVFTDELDTLHKNKKLLLKEGYSEEDIKQEEKSIKECIKYEKERMEKACIVVSEAKKRGLL